MISQSNSLESEISGRKRADEAVQRLAAIVESSDDAIVSKDLDGVIQSWNKGAQRIFGYMAEEVIGKSITILLPPDRYNEEPAILQRLRRGERIDHYETIRRRKDGSLIDISLTVSPVYDMDGKIIGAGKFSDRARHPLPSLVFLDLKLPYLSGFDVLEWLRQQAPFKELPVVVLTSSSEDRDRERAKELGVKAYFVKPPTREMVLEAMQILTNRQSLPP